MRKIVNISMPESMYAYVEKLSRGQEFGSVSEYFRDLVRADKRRRDQLHSERMEREVRYNETIQERRYYS